MTRGDVFTEVQSAEVNISPRSYIEGMDRPNVLYILYTIGQCATDEPFA